MYDKILTFTNPIQTRYEIVIANYGQPQECENCNSYMNN